MGDGAGVGEKNQSCTSMLSEVMVVLLTVEATLSCWIVLKHLSVRIGMGIRFILLTVISQMTNYPFSAHALHTLHGQTGRGARVH